MRTCSENLIHGASTQLGQFSYSDVAMKSAVLPNNATCSLSLSKCDVYNTQIGTLSLLKIFVCSILVSAHWKYSFTVQCSVFKFSSV